MLSSEQSEVSFPAQVRQTAHCRPAPSAFAQGDRRKRLVQVLSPAFDLWGDDCRLRFSHLPTVISFNQSQRRII